MFREINPTTKYIIHSLVAQNQGTSPEVVTTDGKSQSKPSTFNNEKSDPPKAAENNKKMDDMQPALALKETVEKFQILVNNDPESCESKDDATAATDPLTDDDYTNYDDEYAIHYDRIERDRTTTIKYGPKILKKEREDLIKTSDLPSMIKYKPCDHAVEDDQELLNES